MTSSYAPISLEDQAPKPYSFQYGVKDDYAKTNFAHTESQDAQVNYWDSQLSILAYYFQGQVKGTYVIALPDGRIQTTSYTADHLNGYIADVTFQGEPVYPAEKRPAA